MKETLLTASTVITCNLCGKEIPPGTKHVHQGDRVHVCEACAHKIADAFHASAIATVQQTAQQLDRIYDELMEGDITMNSVLEQLSDMSDTLQSIS